MRATSAGAGARLGPARAIVALSRGRFESPDGRARELFTALAKEREVVFVEAPIAADPGVPDSWEIQFAAPRLLVCRPVVHAAGGGYEKAPPARVASMIRKLLRWQGVEEYLVWLDTPHAVPTAQRLDPPFLVYSCADVLWNERGEADPGLVKLEAELVREADLVLVAEPSQERMSATRAAVRVLADLEEAERVPRSIRRQRVLRAPPARRPRRRELVR
ncbi:MAG TPA: hypothetical protein VHQ66_07705 [Myxococcota bacterium]|jgi:hypothetical protein|nr:hypothetical protein [Myxococcota bacterium]